MNRYYPIFQHPLQSSSNSLKGQAQSWELVQNYDGPPGSKIDSARAGLLKRD